MVSGPKDSEQIDIHLPNHASSERKPAGSPSDKPNVIGGWLLSPRWANERVKSKPSCKSGLD